MDTLILQLAEDAASRTANVKVDDIILIYREALPINGGERNDTGKCQRT
jgi:hypothetical protein